MGQLKEKKDIEDMFKKAQKPWAKILEKVNKHKADYHNACKSERSAQNQERNAGGDSSLSPDQVGARTAMRLSEETVRLLFFKFLGLQIYTSCSFGRLNEDEAGLSQGNHSM